MTALRPDNETVFHAARNIPDPDGRREYVREACGGDVARIALIEALLAAADRPDSLLDHPAMGLAADATQVVFPAASGDETPLDFLAPSDKPDVLGRLGHYEILEVIGRGGMGIVLRAFDEKLHRVVAIKVMAAQLATSAMARKRFTREAQAVAAVSHEHVVTIHAVEEANGRPYIVMQYIAGLSLEQRLQRHGSLQLPEILRIGMQMAMGLVAAHAQGLIHRDIKPANILLENGVERVKITDFGLARAVADASLTQTGAVAGTPNYMAPEQARGEALDARTDLFSLGSVLYAMCTGHSPFRGSSGMAVLKRVCDDAPTPIGETNSEIPEWLVAIIDKLHAKDPADRFQSAAEVADLLSGHLAHVQHPSVAPLPAHVQIVQRVAPRVPWLARATNIQRRWAVAAAVLLSCLLGGISLTEATGVTQLAATAIRILTPAGTLLVQVDDPDVKVTIEGDGGLVITGAGPQEVRVRPGSYQVHATKDGKPVRLDRELVMITRGEQEVVKVSLIPPTQRSGSTNELSMDPLSTKEWVWKTPVNLGAPINSEHGEFHPFLAADGLTLVFSSDRPGGQGQQDLWLSVRSSIDSSWQPPVNFGTKVNTPQMEGDSCLSADGLTLLVESDRPGGQGHWDIWMYHRENYEAEWSDAINLGPPINGLWGEGAPWLTPDGLVLLFQTNRPGGEGGDDLWMSHRDSPTSEWSEPVPLGASVNSEQGDFAPSLSSDGRTLFFCSKRSSSNGDLDLWMSRGASAFGPWSRPINLGAPFNGSGHDKGPALSMDGRTLIFESGRAGNLGAHDLWMAARVPNIDYVLQANEYVQRGRLEQAAEAFSIALDRIADSNPYATERLRIVNQFVSSDELFNLILKRRPDDINLWSHRASHLAQVGRSDESIACFQKRLELGPDGAGLWQVYSLALLGHNKDAEYRALCERMLLAFADTPDPAEAGHAALAMVVLPDAVADKQQAFRLAERAVNSNADQAWWVRAIFGAWLYRLDRPEEAIVWLDRGEGGDYQGFSLCFLALAHHRLGRAEEARKYANAVRQKKSTWTEAVNWYMRVRVERLIVEMESVLAADSTKPK